MPSDPSMFVQTVARYSDGRSAARRTAQATLAVDGLALSIDGAEPQTWQYRNLEAATPLHRGDARALLTSAGQHDATVLIDDAAFVAVLIERAPHLTARHSRWQAARPGLLLGGIAAALVILVYALDLSPTKAVARLLPDGFRDQLGDKVVTSMVAERPRCTDPNGRTALTKLVQRIDPARTDAAERVLVVDWGLVNAFAVPGGRVVVTKAIIEKAGSADELAGVLAHEFGHTEELHPEAGLVRGIGFWALLNFMFTGQPGSLGNASAMLAQLSYTRAAEREADTIALAKLKAAGISAQAFAGFFRRMADKPSTSSNPIRRFLKANEVLSTHPAPEQRIARIEAVAAYPSTPALSEADWQMLRGVCGKS